MHCVDLGESFQTHIYLKNFVSIQPRTSLVAVEVLEELRDVALARVLRRLGRARRFIFILVGDLLQKIGKISGNRIVCDSAFF